MSASTFVHCATRPSSVPHTSRYALGAVWCWEPCVWGMRGSLQVIKQVRGMGCRVSSPRTCQPEGPATCSFSCLGARQGLWGQLWALRCGSEFDTAGRSLAVPSSTLLPSISAMGRSTQHPASSVFETQHSSQCVGMGSYGATEQWGTLKQE